MRKALVFLPLVVLLGTIQPAQSIQPAGRPPTGAPSTPAVASAGFSLERLARIDGALQKYVDEGRVAGAVALVLRDGQPVYERAFGWSDKEAGRRMAADSLFRIASQTKSMTSAAILSLVEEGKIGLNDPAGRFILGCIVERASGLPLDQFIRTRITGPLGMKDTNFFVPPTERNRLSAVYASGSEGTIIRAPEGSKGQGDYVEGPRRSFAGGAGLVSTARDYARFLEMIRNGGVLGGARILAPRTVALMTTNQVGSMHSTTGLGYGLGFETTDRYGANGMDLARSLRLGWGLRHAVSCGSSGATGHGADDPVDAQPHRHPNHVPQSGLSGIDGVA